MEKTDEGQEAYRHACLLLSMCSLEAYINGIAEECVLDLRNANHKSYFDGERFALGKGRF